MTDEQIEGLVTRILQRLRPPVLVDRKSVV